MRFNVTLRVNGNVLGRKLPLNYQYELSAAVYRILSCKDRDFASWLHENGFQTGKGKTFKLFVFSRLFPERYRIIPQTNQIELLSDRVEWQIGFLPEKSTQQFIEAVFQNCVFEVGNRQSAVQFEMCGLQLLPSPDFSETMTFDTLSPVSVSQKDELLRDCYPQTCEEFKTASWVKERMLHNLVDKFEAFNGRPFEGERFFDFETTTDPKSSLVTIKAGTPQETKVRGFMCQLALHCPKELMRIAYECGLGEGNGQGFGCLRVV